MNTIGVAMKAEIADMPGARIVVIVSYDGQMSLASNMKRPAVAPFVEDAVQSWETDAPFHGTRVGGS